MAPEGFHKLDSKHEGPLPWNIMFSALFEVEECVGKVGQPCHVPEAEVETRKALWEHITVKREKSNLFDLCEGLQTVLVSKEHPTQWIYL